MFCTRMDEQIQRFWMEGGRKAHTSMSTEQYAPVFTNSPLKQNKKGLKRAIPKRYSEISAPQKVEPN